MEELIGATLDNLTMGAMLIHKNMAVVPLTVTEPGGPAYLTLRQALAQGQVSIQEISEAGSVPELSVVNQSSQFVLLLDGEEICGAKQNRVLNTSILVAPGSKTTIPVSCTEQGRWNYTSKEFSDSGVAMPAFLRTAKQASVSRNVRERNSFASDQGEVWEEVSFLHRDFKVASQTGAMRDAYESKKEDLEAYTQAFASLQGHNGIAVFLGGELVGLDVLSFVPAMNDLLPKLIGSYAMDALRQSSQGDGSIASPEKVRGFLTTAGRCTLSVHPSKGHGEDVRLDGESVQGAALVAEKCVIHLALFAKRAPAAQKPGMASFSRRRQFRGPIQ